MGLYDAVRKEKSRRWHPMWVAALAFAAALVTVLGLTISKPQRDHDRFIRCMSDISSSTTYAFSGKFTSLRARVDGQDLRITQENGYALYGKLFNMNATFSRDVPKEDSLRLDYGDGAVLELWPYHLPDSSDRSEGIFVRFVIRREKPTPTTPTGTPSPGSPNACRRKITRHGRNNRFSQDGFPSCDFS